MQLVKRIALLGTPGTGKRQLAQELRARLAQIASASTDIAVVDADTPLPTACDLALLMGLDLPSAAGGEDADARIRERLRGAAVTYQVVYGHGPQRLRCALSALAAAGVVPAQALEADAPRQRAWTWVCEKCSDPECEHRLFTALQQERRPDRP